LKDTILWLQLQPRRKPDRNCLYYSIKDINEWAKRITKLKICDQEERFYSLLVEVNGLELPVNERLAFLESLHQPVIALIDHLSKTYIGSGLPLAEDKSKYVHRVNSLWSEMATAYKIIIDDLSESSFFTSIIKQKDLACALYHVLFYLSGQLYSNYTLYSACTENVWRDIHQVFRFASNRKLSNRKTDVKISSQLTILNLYKKILLFSLANPYHLTIQEMKITWEYLDDWSELSDLNLNCSKVLTRKYPFLIQAYSDQTPFINPLNKLDAKTDALNFPSVLSASVWGLDTKKLIKRLAKKNKYPVIISNYLLMRLSRSWSGNSNRVENRKE